MEFAQLLELRKQLNPTPVITIAQRLYYSANGEGICSRSRLDLTLLLLNSGTVFQLRLLENFGDQRRRVQEFNTTGAGRKSGRSHMNLYCTVSDSEDQ
jgi:hypothetical protein